MKLDEQRALLATGDGVIARLPGIVLVAVPAAGHEPRIGELIALCREVGEASPEAPGRALARRMAGLLSAADPDTGLALCVLSQTEDGLSVILAGNIDLAASSSRGEVKLSGRDAATWVDRILEGTLGSCSVSAGGAEPPKRTAMYELQGGVVPGVGITFVGGGHVVATPGAAVAAADNDSSAAGAAVAAGAAAGVAAGVSSGASALTDLAEPLPAADPEPEPAPVAAAAVIAAAEVAAPEPPPAACGAVRRACACRRCCCGCGPRDRRWVARWQVDRRDRVRGRHELRARQGLHHRPRARERRRGRGRPRGSPRGRRRRAQHLAVSMPSCGSSAPSCRSSTAARPTAPTSGATPTRTGCGSCRTRSRR